MLSCVHKTLSVFLFLFCISYSRGQDFIYNHYDLQDGLANPTIHSIFQDKDGFIWIGTESGLCRFDGNRFKTFTTKDGLPDNEVFSLLEDSKGRLWLTTYQSAISYIYKGKVYNKQNDSVLKKISFKQRVHGIIEDREKNIWICDNETIFIILHKDNSIRTISKHNALDGKPVGPFLGLSMGDDLNPRICTQTELFSVKNFRFYHVQSISDLALGPNGVLVHPNYIIVGYEVFRRNIYLKDTTLNNALPFSPTIKYSVITDSVFSINTIDGAWLFNINTLKYAKVLPGANTTNVFLDRENNLWIGTQNKGLYKLSSREIVNRRINNTDNNITFITKGNGKIIVGSSGSSVYELGSNGFTVRAMPPSFETFKLLFYEKMQGGENFVTTAASIMVTKDAQVKKFKYILMLKEATPVDDDHILVSFHDGIFLVRKKDAALLDTIWTRKSLSALKTNDSILAGTMSGLFVLKQGKNGYYIADSLFNNTIIAYVKKSANNMIWVGSFENGIYCIKDGKVIRHFSDTSGLPSNICRTIYINGDDAWIGTDKGIVKITPVMNDFHVKKYSTSDGLPSNIINTIYIDSNIIYVGTPEGLCYFNERMIETTSMCNLALTGVKIGDSQVDFSNEYFLSKRQRLIIEYSGISFRSEREMTYRYRFNGIDDNWQSTSLNSLEFTSLPYGQNELEIIAINKFGKESAPLKMIFHVQKPFYETTWFIVLMVLLPLSIFLFAWNRRMNEAKKRQMQKLQQEIKILELEQMALRAQMNPHFIFNCISTIQQLVTESDIENTNKFITSFSNLVRQTLDNAPELFISLDEEIKFLANYFELERIRLEDRFSYAINVAGITKTEQLQVPNMVIQPFIENAIRHGIRYKKDGKGFIEVIFKQQDGSLRCTITDNGIGRERAGQIKKELGIHHVSKGMGIIFKRIESLSTMTNGNISIAIEDMKDGSKAMGTKVIIDFNKTRHNDQNSYNRR